jgi:hypothetical protein
MRTSIALTPVVWVALALPAFAWGVVSPTHAQAPQRVEVILVRDGGASRLVVRARFAAVGKGARWIVPVPAGCKHLVPDSDPFEDLPALRHAVRKEVYKKDLATWKKVQRGQGPARFWDRPSPPKKPQPEAGARLQAGKSAPLDAAAAAKFPQGSYLATPVTGAGWSPTVELRGPGASLRLGLLANFSGTTELHLTLLGDRDGFLPLGGLGHTRTFETLAGGNRVKPTLTSGQKRLLKALKATGPLPRKVRYREHELGKLSPALFRDAHDWKLLDAVPKPNDVRMRVLAASLKNLAGPSNKALLASAARFSLINLSQPAWRAKLQEACRKHVDTALPGLIEGLHRKDKNALSLLVDGYVRSPSKSQPVPGQAKAWIPAAHHGPLMGALRAMAQGADQVTRRRLSYVVASLR